MNYKTLDVESFIDNSRSQLIIDVRAPVEYHHAHIPGAVNIPLFTDIERHHVGTLYKTECREAAIKLGLDYFGPKMRPIVEQVEQILQDQRQTAVYIHCWRGGMRSSAIAWLLGMYGFNVFLLEGGYKAFRNYVIQTLDEDYVFYVVGGNTGAGKTKYLEQLQTEKRANVINLEDIAQHRGSAFGHLGLQDQPSQEMFENQLAYALSSFANGPIWIEDESQRIGHVYIPKSIYQQMQNAPLFLMKVPFAQRLQYTVQHYGQYDQQLLKDAVLRISKRLGGLESKHCLQFIDRGLIQEAFAILLQYYDRWYEKSLLSNPNRKIKIIDDLIG